MFHRCIHYAIRKGTRDIYARLRRTEESPPKAVSPIPTRSRDIGTVCLVPVLDSYRLNCSMSFS